MFLKVRTLVDEINFGQVVQKSKQSAEGGTYDQAESLYNSLARRRESRFSKGGKLPGVLCLVSSKRFPGEFTDKKIEEAQKDSSIYFIHKVGWFELPTAFLFCHRPKVGGSLTFRQSRLFFNFLFPGC